MGSYHRVPEDEALESLRERSRVRGQPLLLPEQDFEDRIALANDNLWQLDPVEIRQASARYQPDAVLAGRYQLTEEGVLRASWLLIEGESELRFEDSAESPAALFARVLDAASDYFARRYAIVPGEANDASVVMRVEGVSDFAAHKQLQLYLEGLAMVRKLELLQVDREGQLLRLTLDGDQALLLTTLQLGRRLVPEPSALSREPSAFDLEPSAFDLEPSAFDLEPSTQSAPPAFEQVLEQGLPPADAPFIQGGSSAPLVFRWQP
jgi:hypothetical protein